MKTPEFSSWSSLCTAAGAKSGISRTYEALVSLYDEGARAYHNLQHIAQCLEEFNALKSLAANPSAVALALWYHDAVYDPRAGDNETESAKVAMTDLATMGIEGALPEKVRELIMMTKHERIPSETDACVVVDVDLSILGQPAEVFDAYDRGIRAEYSWVSDDQFWPKRGDFLKSLLSRERIYHTSACRKRLERVARDNLERAVRRIQKNGGTA
jgi:predicted metal-dependent HD superfamily phosphohydrolase